MFYPLAQHCFFHYFLASGITAEIAHDMQFEIQAPNIEIDHDTQFEIQAPGIEIDHQVLLNIREEDEFTH